MCKWYLLHIYLLFNKQFILKRRIIVANDNNFYRGDRHCQLFKNSLRSYTNAQRLDQAELRLTRHVYRGTVGLANVITTLKDVSNSRT